MDRPQLLRISQGQLDELFKKCPAGSLPDGEGIGAAIVCPGTLCSRFVAWFVRWFLWQGKVFHADEGWLSNRISAFSCQGVKAQVRKDKSWLDGKECIVLDYSQTSFVARMIRNEIREIAPRLYLGKVYWGRKRLIDFMVSFQYGPAPKHWRRAWATLGLPLVIAIGYLGGRLTRDLPITYDHPVEHFKYGSTGGERTSGIPLSLWKALPELFAQYLPGQGLQSLGFVYEDGQDFPIGTSRRNVQGIERIFFNCAICHVGTVRDTPESKPRVIVGMPANTVDLQAFQRFLSACAVDENFNAARIMDQIAKENTEDRLNRALLRYAGIDLMRERLLTFRQRLSFMDRDPVYRPGRVDTFNPPKGLLNFRTDNLPTNEVVGICNFPSVCARTRPCSTPRTPKSASDISARPSATQTSRSTGFGCARRTCTMARCRRCAICWSRRRCAQRCSIAAATFTNPSAPGSSGMWPSRKAGSFSKSTPGFRATATSATKAGNTALISLPLNKPHCLHT